MSSPAMPVKGMVRLPGATVKKPSRAEAAPAFFPCRDRAMDILTVSVMDKGMTVMMRMGMSTGRGQRK